MQYSFCGMYYDGLLVKSFSGVHSPAGPIMQLFLFDIGFRKAVRPTEPPIHWVPATPTPGVKRPGHEADQTPPCSA
jgi:hypothetical protein